MARPAARARAEPAGGLNTAPAAAERRRNYAYDAFGNLTSKKSGTDGDLDVVHTVETGKNGPYRLTEAAVGGTTTSSRTAAAT